MLKEDFAEVVLIISGLSEKIQSVTDRQKEISKKIVSKIEETKLLMSYSEVGKL